MCIYINIRASCTKVVAFCDIMCKLYVDFQIIFHTPTIILFGRAWCPYEGLNDLIYHELLTNVKKLPRLDSYVKRYAICQKLLRQKVHELFAPTDN